MRKKPIFILILGLIHLFEPLAKVLMIFFSEGFSIDETINQLQVFTTVRLFFEFWLLYPLGGVLLLLFRSWSYAGFVSVQFYSLLSQLKYLADGTYYLPAFYTLLLLNYNIILIAIFTFPKIRRPFLDRTTRWWESKTRYAVNIPCDVFGRYTSLSQLGEILNLSETGVFLKGDLKLNKRDQVQVKFSYEDIDIDAVAIVKSKHPFQGEIGWGLEYIEVNPRTKNKLKKLSTILGKKKKDTYGRV